MPINKYLTRLVKNILIKNVPSRDDWMMTIKEVHDKEMELMSFDKERYYEAFFGGHLSNVHTVKRLWQLIQEKHPELRGTTWVERQKQGGLIAQEVAEEQYFQLELFPNTLELLNKI